MTPRPKRPYRAVIASIVLLPVDVGGRASAHWLEGRGVFTVGPAGNGVGHWDLTLGVNEYTAV